MRSSSFGADEAKESSSSQIRDEREKSKKRERPTNYNAYEAGGDEDGQDPFPLKLHKLLEQLEQEGRHHIVGWNPDGKSFSVFKPTEFVDQIMTKHFPRQSKYKSFQRQLNLYEFTRESFGSVKGIYAHRLFLRDNRELCKKMRRQKQGNLSGSFSSLILPVDGWMRSQSSSDDEVEERKVKTTTRGSIDEIRPCGKNEFSKELRTGALLMPATDLRAGSSNNLLAQSAQTYYLPPTLDTQMGSSSSFPSCVQTNRTIPGGAFIAHDSSSRVFPSPLDGTMQTTMMPVTARPISAPFASRSGAASIITAGPPLSSVTMGRTGYPNPPLRELLEEDASIGTIDGFDNLDL